MQKCCCYLCSAAVSDALDVLLKLIVALADVYLPPLYFGKLTSLPQQHTSFILKDIVAKATVYSILCV